MAAAALRLLFTVGGGLEDLAEEEVRGHFASAASRRCPHPRRRPAADRNVVVRWKARGNSGSQLEAVLSFGGEEGAAAAAAEEEEEEEEERGALVADAVSALRFVDYVYLRILSERIESDDGADGGDDGKDVLLGRVRDAVSAGVAAGSAAAGAPSLDSALRIGRRCQEVLRDRDVGLGKLPGALLPTPEVDASAMADPPAPAGDGGGGGRDRVVNTIYTRDEVAEAVAETFVRLVRDHYPSAEADGGGVRWVDAGSGSGALLRHLPRASSVGVDTHPSGRADDVLRMDFLTEVTAERLRGGGSGAEAEHLCVISNPPFSERSRGDYTAVVKFVNRSAELGALCAGVIAPVKFARERIWASLGLTGKAELLARFLLPDRAFYDPSDGKVKHVNSMFLFFGLQRNDGGVGDVSESEEGRGADPYSSDAIHVEGKRDKGSFPRITTADLSSSVAWGLHDAGADLGSEDEAPFAVSAKLSKARGGGGACGAAAAATLELDLLLNPRRPLSLSNCASRSAAGHSLGWISSSAKPPVARAMVRLATTTTSSAMTSAPSASAGNGPKGDSSKKDARTPEGGAREERRRRSSVGGLVVVNAMSGEGTIELEAQGEGAASGEGGGDGAPALFVIGGDKDAAAAAGTARRLASLGVAGAADGTGKGRGRGRPMVDVVVWDAQRLPLRRGAADAYLADLPYAGSKKKRHQEPRASGGAAPAPGADGASPLDYGLVMAEAVRVLRPGGRAALLSADARGMGRAVVGGRLNWKPRRRSDAVNLGGLVAGLSVMERRGPCCKDLSARVVRAEGGGDWSEGLLRLAREACAGCGVRRGARPGGWVDRVELRYAYFDEETESLSHCYRFYFDDLLIDQEAKVLEKAIRAAVERSPPEGILQLR